MHAAAEHRAGYVALVGRPNVGKSTLVNRLVGAKVAIVTPKPQTTRNRIAGIVTRPGAQIVLLDTPGICQGADLMNRRMVEIARRCLAEADVALLVIDAAAGFTVADRELAAGLAGARLTTIVALNKMDSISRPGLLPLMAAAGKHLPGREVVPCSALTGENVDELAAELVRALPPGPALFPPDEYTDQSERAIVQEIVREQVYLQTRQEIPYSTAVLVEQFRDDTARGLLVVHATILVERPSQKAIIIGKGGRQLVSIGRAARLELERLFATRVYLELFVRVERGWRNNQARLRELGI